MNRTLGFGIVATSTAAAVLATPTPALAHQHGINSDCGEVSIVPSHHAIWVGDWACATVTATFAQFTRSGEKEVYSLYAPRDQYAYYDTVTHTIASFRKCHKYTSGSTGCSNWVTVT